MVVRSITVRERISKALQEVGEVRSFYDGRDSIPLRRKGTLLCAHRLQGEEYSIPPQGGMKIENA